MAGATSADEYRRVAWGTVIPLSLFFSAIGSIWITATEIVFRSAQVGEAVPPVPAVATLVFLLVLRPLLSRVSPRLHLSSREVLAIYSFTTIAMTIGFVNGVRNIFELATIPYYGEKNDAALNLVRKYWPAWIAPRDTDVVRGMWQGSRNGCVPWRAWIVPLVSTGALILLVQVMTGALLGLLHRHWLQHERLTYPVAELAISIAHGSDEGRPRLFSQLWSSRLFRLGILGALLFNAVWIIPALRPAATVPQQYTNLNEFLPPGPWRAGYIWFIRYNLAALGLAILVPTDVLFTVWFSTLVLKAEAVFLAFLGRDWSSTFLLASRQGLGGYFAEAIFLVWSARKSYSLLMRAKRDGKGSGEWSERTWLFLFALSAFGLLAILLLNGMAGWLALAVLAIVTVRVLVVSRIRAQVGVPILYFHVGDFRSLASLVGGAAIVATGERSMTAVVAFSFLAICAYLAPYQSDGFRIAESCNLGAKRWVLLSLAAVVVGFVFAVTTQLFAYYRYGSEPLGWTASPWPVASTAGGFMPGSAEPWRWASISVGFVTTAGLILAQRTFTWWPLHPIGFVVACAIGGYVFGPALVAWAAKSLSLRYGGLKGYERTKEFFLGLVIGHFAVATLWGALGALNYAPTKRYIIGFW